MRKLLVALTTLGLLLGACSSDDDKKTASDTTTSAVRTSEPGFAARLLAVGDLPPGFAQEGEVDEAAGALGEVSDAFCEALSDAQTEPARDHEAQVTFQLGTEGSTNGLYILQKLSRLKSEDDATDAFAALRGAFEDCKTFTENDPDANTTMKGTFTSGALKSSADETFSTRMEATQAVTDGTASLNFDGDFAILHKGKHIVLLALLIAGDAQFPSGTLQSLADKAVAKL